MPGTPVRATLTDLLERVLEKGIVISADVVISAGGVPLLGLNLRAILAGMETMVQYGLLREMDQSVRTAASLKAPRSGRPHWLEPVQAIRGGGHDHAQGKPLESENPG